MKDSHLAQSFDSVASDYDKYRTGYPKELSDKILELCRVKPTSCTALEIGCGTGQATCSFANQGIRIICVEPGPELIKTAQRNLQQFPNVTFINAKLEDVKIPWNFDLIFAAQSFHWVDKEVSYSLVSQLLKPNALFAAFWKRERPKSDALTKKIHNLLSSYLPSFRSETVDEYEFGIVSDLREMVESRRFYGCQLIRLPLPPKTSDAETYANSLSTWSMIATLPSQSKSKLLFEIRTLIEENDNVIMSDTQEITLVCGYGKGDDR